MKQGRKSTFQRLKNGLRLSTFPFPMRKITKGLLRSMVQIFSWVRKFEKVGSNGLLPRSSKGLESKPNLSPEEELRLKIKQQKERVKYLEMENGLLKKLEEIKRRNDGKAWSPLENLPSDKRICE